MSEKTTRDLSPAFRHKFSGMVWNMVAHPSKSLLFLELRDENSRLASFSALDLPRQELLWNDLTFEEKWWISLADASGSILFFTVFTNTHNPDRKSLIAYDFETRKIAWWRNNFALSCVTPAGVYGMDLGMEKSLVISLATGQNDNHQPVLPVARNFPVFKPLQYYPDSAHFETVSTVLALKCGMTAVSLIEYLEYQSLILVSFYVQDTGLANFLIVFNAGGELLLKEKIGDHLKGLGIDTFFVFSGYLFFVRNKSELVSYKI